METSILALELQSRFRVS